MLAFLARTIGLMVALALPAKADVGVPMLAVTWPGMLLALIPIVLLEAWVLNRRLRLSARRSLKFSIWANLASTVVGVPVTWGVLLFSRLLGHRIWRHPNSS